MLLLSGNLTEESHNKLVTTTTKLKKNSLFCIDSSWVGKAGHSDSVISLTAGHLLLPLSLRKCSRVTVSATSVSLYEGGVCEGRGQLTERS